jgi:hypothetical protein
VRVPCNRNFRVPVMRSTLALPATVQEGRADCPRYILQNGRYFLIPKETKRSNESKRTTVRSAHLVSGW